MGKDGVPTWAGPRKVGITETRAVVVPPWAVQSLGKGMRIGIGTGMGMDGQVAMWHKIGDGGK